MSSLRTCAGFSRPIPGEAACVEMMMNSDYAFKYGTCCMEPVRARKWS